MRVQKVKPFLWFDNQAEEAANFYVSLFADSQVVSVNPMIVTFELSGIQMIALNGGPVFKFTEAFSLFVDCDDQSEIDTLWDRLSEGGSSGQCGWLKDRYGLSWQIVPSVLPKWLLDPQHSGRVMQAMLKMSKLDIQQLQDAYNGHV